MFFRRHTKAESVADPLRHDRHQAEVPSPIETHTLDQGYPVLADSEVLRKHMFILGANGSGKTPSPPVVVVEHKQS